MTVVDICGQAEPIIASVNYHFLDKENLNLEAWRYAFQQDLERYPSDGGINPDAATDHRATKATSAAIFPNRLAADDHGVGYDVIFEVVDVN